MLNYRKDTSPQETIKNIKKILKKNRIKTKEYKIKSINKDFFSVRIEIKGFYNMGTNGKGITPILAKASGYAELMERIQSRILVNNYYLNKNNNLFNFKKECLNDEVFNNLDLKSFFSTKKYNALFIDNDRYRVMDIYKDLLTNKNCYLPTKLIYLTSSSNGLCAGNNYYEALNQGIAEIFERYIYRKILFEDMKLGDITIDNDLPIYRKIKELEKKGYNITIKNCTNNILPVVGVLIIKDDKYLFTLGSDCDLNIAIQRCLTEAFQGLSDFQQINNKMKPIDNNYDKLSDEEKHINWLQCYASNNGIHPNSIFKSILKTNYRKLNVFKNFSSNEEVFNYMLEIIKKMKKSIYVKDYSYLGFNTYKIYIPSLSNISFITDKEVTLYKNYDIIKNIYFDLLKYNDDQNLINTIDILKEIMNYKKYSFVSLGNFFHTERYLKTNYNNINFAFFVGLLELKVYNKVISIKLFNDDNVKTYYKKINSLPFSNKLNYVIKDLNLKVPTCPNCKSCILKKNCRYKKWKKINKILKTKEALFKE